MKTVNLFTYAASPSPPTDLFVFQWKLTDTQTTSYILELMTRLTSCTTLTYTAPHKFFLHAKFGASSP